MLKGISFLWNESIEEGDVYFCVKSVQVNWRSEWILYWGVQGLLQTSPWIISETSLDICKGVIGLLLTSPGIMYRGSMSWVQRHLYRGAQGSYVFLHDPKDHVHKIPRSQVQMISWIMCRGLRGLLQRCLWIKDHVHKNPVDYVQRRPGKMLMSPWIMYKGRRILYRYHRDHRFLEETMIVCWGVIGACFVTKMTMRFFLFLIVVW